MKAMNILRRCTQIAGAVLAAGLLLTAASAKADSFQGAIFTSDVNHVTNLNAYDTFFDIYLNGGGSGVVLEAGNYCYAITDTSASTLVTSIGSFTQTAADVANGQKVFFNIMTGVAPEGGPVGSGVNLILPVLQTGGNEYKLLVGQDTDASCPDTLAGLKDLATKSDNFKVLNVTITQPVPEPGVVAFAAVNGIGMLGLMVRSRRRKLHGA